MRFPQISVYLTSIHCLSNLGSQPSLFVISAHNLLVSFWTWLVPLVLFGIAHLLPPCFRSLRVAKGSLRASESPCGYSCLYGFGFCVFVSLRWDHTVPEDIRKQGSLCPSLDRLIMWGLCPKGPRRAGHLTVLGTHAFLSHLSALCWNALLPTCHSQLLLDTEIKLNCHFLGEAISDPHQK